MSERLNKLLRMGTSELDALVAQTHALSSAIVLMEVDIRQQHRELAGYKELGMTEAVSVKRGLIERAEKNLETIKAMWETMR